MRRRMRNLVVMGLVVLTLAIPGCLVVVAGGAAAGGVAYVKGDLEAVVPGTPQQVARATDGAAADLRLIKVSSESSSTDMKYLLRTAGDKKITVTAKRESDRTSKLSIRVGIFGDKDLSQMLYDRIR
ncbi:MAG: DUF3568 family protein, partial [Phycisphaeraceae bacterium]|nr:DUF3568 family protein [Phycisphaeraceae bacterium]